MRLFFSLLQQIVSRKFMLEICLTLDLLDDWASRLRPDIYRFIPYTLKINFMLKEFELALVSNEWNWINCSGQNRENCKYSKLLEHS